MLLSYLQICVEGKMDLQSYTYTEKLKSELLLMCVTNFYKKKTRVVSG